MFANRGTGGVTVQEMLSPDYVGIIHEGTDMDDILLGFLLGAALVGLMGASCRRLPAVAGGCEHDWIRGEHGRRCWRCDAEE